MTRICSLVGIFALIAPCAATAAQGDFDVSTELIADSSMEQPGRPGYLFTGLSGQELVNTGDSVLFTNFNFGGFGIKSLGGIYRWSRTPGTTTVVTDERSEPFLEPADRYVFENNYIDKDHVVFRARFSTSVQGIFLSSSSQEPTRLFGAGDTLPDQRGAATDVTFPRVRGDDVLFTARGDDGLGRVYRTDLSGGNITTLLDENTPGVIGAQNFSLGDFEDGYLAFRTRDAPLAGRQTGVFTTDLSGNLNAIARLGDPLPGAPGQTIGALEGGTLHPSISDGKVVYAANGSGGTDGIYIAPVTGGASEVVVDDTMVLPGDTGITAGFALASISGNNVSFLGVSASGTSTGLWVSVNGTLVDIAIRNAEFDGRIVRDVFSSPFSMHNNTVAFEVVFTNGDRGLYLATVTPTPGAAMLLALSGVWTARRRRGSLRR